MAHGPLVYFISADMVRSSLHGDVSLMICVFSGFVLVIQEKDLVQLKVVKQLLRRALRRERDLSEKLERYKVMF